MRVGISGAHGTGKTTLAEALCARLPGHVTAEPPCGAGDLAAAPPVVHPVRDHRAAHGQRLRP